MDKTDSENAVKYSDNECSIIDLKVPTNDVENAQTENLPGSNDSKNASTSNAEQTIINLEKQITRLKVLLQQKESNISLLEREKTILEKEKCALKANLESSIKEKENVVIRFATKEKNLLDAKKEKELAEKQLADSKREIKNITTKFHMINDEKCRISSMLEEKCNEIKRFQKDNDKLKTDVTNLEMKLKWNLLKLTQETENKIAIEKRLDEMTNERSVKTDDKFSEQQRMELEANLILIKHENETKEKNIELLKKENKDLLNKLTALQSSLIEEEKNKNTLAKELDAVKDECNSAQNSLSQELLNSAKLRGELEALKVVQAQNMINEEKIVNLTQALKDAETKIEDFEVQVKHLREREAELLTSNKEMSEMIVGLQNQICLQNSKIQAIESENEMLQKEKLDFDSKLEEVQTKLNEEIQQKVEDRLILTKHISEKTKLYEAIKVKLDNAIGDLEATKKKHSQVIKELHREINKCKKQKTDNIVEKPLDDETLERHSTRSSAPSQSDSEVDSPSNTFDTPTTQEPSKQHLVDRILRLQQAAARQTEKVDFLENHTMSLVAELQKKSKILQYYMLRDQSGALTSNKSDQNKTELAKYGGVMSAIYTGIKGSNQSMTLDLSLEINRKLQAVLEDTLLKNITLKENLDVLGLEVDKLTRQLARVNASNGSR